MKKDIVLVSISLSLQYLMTSSFQEHMKKLKVIGDLWKEDLVMEDGMVEGELHRIVHVKGIMERTSSSSNYLKTCLMTFQ